MDKSILFIAPNFYDYHKIIEKGFIEAGYDVDYFDDRPGTSFLTKALIRINKNFLKVKINKYFNTILSQAKKKNYDIVFVLYGQSFSRDMIKKLRLVCPKSKFIFYMYDPIFSMPDRLDFSKEFDKCFTFDLEDSIKYKNFVLLPLFYSNKMNYIKSSYKYDACYLGTIMPGKYKLVKKIVNDLRKHKYNVFSYPVLQSRFVWLYYKLFKKEFKNSKVSEFKFKRLTKDESTRLIGDSKIVIDCQKQGQSGLTIRTFECLASSKKMITTNESIKNYDFYRPENIYIFKEKIDYNDIFFKTDFVHIDDRIVQKYSLQNWVKSILN